VKKARRKLVKQIAAQLAMEFMGMQRKPRRAQTKRTARKVAQAAASGIDIAAAVAAPTASKPLRITPHHVGLSRQKVSRYPQVNPFALPQFPVQLTDHVPADRRMAMDQAIAGTAAWAGDAFAAMGGNIAFEGVAFLGYPYLSELAQRPEYRVIVETIATEMTRKWIRLEAKGDQDKSEKIAELTDELDRLKVREAFCKSAEVDGYFGRAHLYLDTGQTDNPAELKTPIGNGENGISKRKFKKGSFERLAVVEPVWTYPSSYNSNNPLKPDWYNPQMWFVMQNEIHVSRCLRFVGREVPDMLKPAYSFGGLSLTQMAKPYVENWLNTRQSVSDIIRAFSVMVLGTNLGESLTPGGEELFARADLFNNTRDNRGLMMIDAETEEFQNVAAPLGSLDALQAQAQEHMASVSRIPLVKLLGISPHGLNGTAEPELRAFYDTIKAQQEKFFSPNLRKVIAFAQMNIWGKVDPDISFEYENLWSLDEKGEAEIRKLDADTAAILVDHGIIDPVEDRARVANDPSTKYPGLVIDDVPDLKEEEENGLEPKGSAEKLAGTEGDGDDDAPDVRDVPDALT
jgi:phage-related protein (TIGR01555 family)